VSSWAGRRVLVTGASGFIGSHLVEALVIEGADVRALVHYNSRNDWGNLELLPAPVRAELDVVAGDVADGYSVARVVTGRETVFHLAALIGIPYSYVAPASYVATNVTGTLNVLEAARVAGVSKIVHTSTSEVYGTARYTPIDENHPLQGQSPYSASKIGADKLSESYYLSFDVPVATLRPFNTYGPRQSLRAVIPTIANQALSSGSVRLGLLSPTRDFTFVADTVRAFLAVAESENTVGLTLNAASGKSMSIGDLAQTILSLLGSDAVVETDPVRIRPESSEVQELIGDASHLRSLTDWEPRVKLSDGLGATIDWLRERPEMAKARRYNV
jgi:NAD dependent epimerase/dehydratase